MEYKTFKDCYDVVMLEKDKCYPELVKEIRAFIETVPSHDLSCFILLLMDSFIGAMSMADITDDMLKRIPAANTEVV